ncbi:hypothetical protein HH214_07795 [Mucilaginibacter robiniae]|uniref:Uncharacterized protein n=1 Tax=Mucilaginibacter robiniae TaxID=2728022 RepID=A0A7L5DXF0_9SPHI|nr:hypothetical protein [Mucilaginibacter robiniae]QJD95780.1 hypothetical protein HH214_07795 [Mucilaginibacter robiniae]
MSVAEIEKIKTDLIAWIEQLSDSDTLAFLDGLKDSKVNHDWWQDISEDQQKHITEGLNDQENGRVFSSGDFWTNLKNGE